MSEHGLSDFEDDSQLEKEFADAAKYLQTIVSTVDQTSLLQLYGLYKQATVGKCNTAKPGMFALQAKAKWNAWNDLHDMTTEVAMQKYVDQMCEINPDWQQKRSRAPGAKKEPAWVSVSTLAFVEAELEASSKSCFDHAKEGNVAQLETAIADGVLIDALDTDGLAMLHWASDRGHVAIVERLIVAGCDVNLRDSDGQTALHYAASVGHVECLRLLLSAGADRDQTDDEGQTCLDAASDPDVRKMLWSRM